MHVANVILLAAWIPHGEPKDLANGSHMRSQAQQMMTILPHGRVQSAEELHPQMASPAQLEELSTKDLAARQLSRQIRTATDLDATLGFTHTHTAATDLDDTLAKKGKTVAGATIWTVATRSQSCTETCKSVSSTCNYGELKKSSESQQATIDAYKEAGFSCSNWGTGCSNGNNCPAWGAPYLHTSHFSGSSAQRNGKGAPCFYGNDVGQCHQVPVDGHHRRLCACGTSYANSIDSRRRSNTLRTWKPKDCWKDTGHRALRSGPQKYGYTQDSCMNACPTFKYFALQHGGWCCCENDWNHVKKYGRAPGDCDARGTAWVNAVYEAIPPPKCVMGAWGTWTLCSKTCGGGSHTRVRKVAKMGSGCGAAATSEQRACNVQACPVDCEVSSWAAWSVCAPCAKNVDKTVAPAPPPAAQPFPASPDMSGGTAQDPKEFLLSATIKTSAADGTIFAKAWPPTNKWQSGGSSGQGKMLFVKGGKLSFDIGWVGVVRSTRTVSDGQEHRVGVQFKNKRYELVVDGQVDGTGLSTVPDNGGTVWTVGKGVGHGSGSTSLGNNGDMAPDFVGDIKDLEYKADGVVYTDAPPASAPPPAEGGQQERTRLCTKSAAHGGACPDLKEQQGCNAPLCPTTTVTSTTTTTTMTTTTTTTTTSTTTTTTTTITRGVSAKFPGQICVQTARLQAYSSKDYIACQDACRENVACNRFAIPNSLTCDSSLGIRPDDCFLYKRDSENCACELGDLACMTTYELTGGTGGDDLEGALSRDAHPEGTLLEDDAAPDFPEPFKKP